MPNSVPPEEDHDALQASDLDRVAPELRGKPCCKMHSRRAVQHEAVLAYLSSIPDCEPSPAAIGKHVSRLRGEPLRSCSIEQLHIAGFEGL